jgi:putative ATP-dependent endonuclease of OLD family
MHFTRVHVKNFRSLRDADIQLSRFTCTVGHNNAGKSSFMIALVLFLTGDRLSPTDFYDRDAEVSITVDIEGIDELDLARLTPEQQGKLAPLVVEGKLRLVRRYKTDGTSTLRCVCSLPRENRFLDDYISAELKGKKPTEIPPLMRDIYPELGDVASSLRTQAAAKEAVKKLREALPPEKLMEGEASLPTGIPESVANLLPEALYIPAVLDVRDQLKTKEAASFGRIVKVLLDMIANTDQIRKISESFAELHKLLNRVQTDDGTFLDERIEEVKQIEALLQSNLQEQFADVRLELEVPPPELKAVFSGAKIILEDGVRAEAETKGDGVQRALTFSLIRTYAELRGKFSRSGGEAGARRQGFILLFEEPELYLHPRAQRILYDALEAIAEEQQVCVSTHSPYFLTANCKGAFIRVKKDPSPDTGAPPCSGFRPLDLSASLPIRDAFQVMCYENNAAAFFADRVVLVEGDSDQIYLKHVAERLHPAWDFDARNIAIVQTGGKGGLERYWSFFDHFGVDVRVVADLDVLLKGFEKLRPTAEEQALQSTLMQRIDEEIATLAAPPKIKSEKAKKLVAEPSFGDRLRQAREIVDRVARGGAASAEDVEILDSLRASVDQLSRLWALINIPKLKPDLDTLLYKLRMRGVNVLRKGAIEQYYPPGTVGPDKPSRALNACSRVARMEDVCACCDEVDVGGEMKPELWAICANLFGGISSEQYAAPRIQSAAMVSTGEATATMN